MKKNILIITSGLTAGGVDSLILNVLSEKPNDEYHIDLMIFDDSKNDWQEKFENYGCKVIVNQRARKLGTIKAIKNYKKIFREGGYNIIHSHIGFGSVLPVLACVGLKNVMIAVHAHFDDYPDSPIIQKLGHIVFKVFPCKKLACSNGAGKALYGEKASFTFVKNGIDSERFSYDEKIREEVRREFNLSSSCFLVGMVGRMDYQKNHDFLLDIFKEIHNLEPNSKLMLVGDGKLHSEIVDKANKLGILNNIIFTGIRGDVYRLLQGMDVFIMPTRFEGLSLALLEVECSGLPCLTTDVVPREVKVDDDFEFLSLSDSAKRWAEDALHYRTYKRKSGSQDIIRSGYDKHECAATWYKIYDSLI